MNKIYTKTGDAGKTGTFKGRMSKSDQLAIALGTVDELDSWVGLCRTQYPILDEELHRMQNNLLTIGSGLAGSGKNIAEGETERLEKIIDQMTSELPALSNFVFPVGYLQVARTVARRAEREVVKAEAASADVLQYLNRLSDGLFTMARWMNAKLGLQEEVWKG